MSCPSQVINPQPPAPITPIFLANVRFLVKNEGKNVIIFGYFGLIGLTQITRDIFKVDGHIVFVYLTFG